MFQKSLNNFLDTNIFCSDNNLHNLMLTVIKELKKLCDRFAVNKLSSNLNKTNIIMIFNYMGKNQIRVHFE